MLLFAARLTVAATVTLFAAGAAPHPPARHETLSVTVAPTGQQVIGTTYLETDAVSRDGQPFGLDVLTCPGAGQAGVAVARCTVDFGLESGTLQASITQNNTTGKVNGPIDGGTGRYQGATGRVSGQGTDNGASLTITLSGTP
jgi:hypothetical protein